MIKENGEGSNGMVHILNGPATITEKHQTCLFGDYVFLKFHNSQRKLRDQDYHQRT